MAAGEVRLTDRLTAMAITVVGVAAWHNWRAWRRATADQAARPDPSPAEWPTRPFVSVLVAAWNEAEMIPRHIESFKELGYPAKQLIICAGGADGTFEIARRLADAEVRVLEQRPGEGKQRSLQRCFEAAEGDIIMLADADCLLSESAFRQLLAPIVLGESDVVTGYREPLQEQRGSLFTRPQWFTEAAAEGARHHVNGLWGGNCAMRREAIERAGAFLEPAATGTDYVQARTLLNAGYRIDWIPDSRVETRYPQDVTSYLRAWRRWIKNILIHGPRLGDWRGTAETVVAITLAAGTILPPLVVPIAGRIALLGPMTALCVATLNRVRRFAIGSRVLEAPASWRLYAAAPAFAVLDQLAAVLAAYDVLTRRGRSRW